MLWRLPLKEKFVMFFSFQTPVSVYHFQTCVHSKRGFLDHLSH